MSDQDTDGSYTAFVRITWTDHLGVARLLTGDADRAEELLQDCLVKLYPRWWCCATTPTCPNRRWPRRW